MFSVTSFRCPGCGEYINSEMKQCKYCSMLIDPQTAGNAVAVQEKINDACNDASNIRNYASGMWVLYFFGFIPLVGLVSYVSFVLFFIVLVKLIIWQGRYGAIKTSDVDFKQAYRNWIIALVLWLLMLIIPIGLIILYVGLIAATSR
jgi:hypothetical protein